MSRNNFTEEFDVFATRYLANEIAIHFNAHSIFRANQNMYTVEPVPMGCWIPGIETAIEIFASKLFSERFATFIGIKHSLKSLGRSLAYELSLSESRAFESQIREHDKLWVYVRRDIMVHFCPTTHRYIASIVEWVTPQQQT